MLPAVHGLNVATAAASATPPAHAASSPESNTPHIYRPKGILGLGSHTRLALHLFGFHAPTPGPKPHPTSLIMQSSPT